MGVGQARDRAWFEHLILAHGNRVLAYAARRVSTDADDIVAEVFTAAWKHRDKVPDEALPWLYRTAAHQIMHSRRSSSRRDALVARTAQLDPAQRVQPDPTDALASRLDDSKCVAAMLAALTPRDAEVLRLWSWEQLDTQEIAFVLGITGAAARVRLHRAKRRAAALLPTTRTQQPLVRIGTTIEEHT